MSEAHVYPVTAEFAKNAHIDKAKYEDMYGASIDDSEARKDWNWKHQFDLAAITKEMLKNIKTESIV